MTFDRWLLLGACAALLIAIYLAGWWYRDCPRWFLGCACRDTDLPGPETIRVATPPRRDILGRTAEGSDRAGEPHDDEWDDGWQREPWTDADADQLIADLRGEGPEVAVIPGVFDQWWAGLDGLERECMLVHDLVVREAREWAEIKAETREMCAA